MKDGIMLAGNIIVDTVKEIDRFPKRLALAAIHSVRLAGGGLSNAIKAFAQLDKELPIRVVGCAGEDSNGDFFLNLLKEYPNVDVSGIRREGITSFTDVMTEPSGERTFFTYKAGADASLGDEDFVFENCGCNLLHFSYILLMDGMDAPDPEFGTVLARTLYRAQQAGLLTSIDVVSEFGDRYQRIVPPSLTYTDFCTMNEFEAENSTGIPLRDEATGRLMTENMELACKKLKEMGVRRWVTIHAPEGSFGMDEQGAYAQCPSAPIPKEQIKATVGAGDSFLAGLLYAAHKGRSHQEAMRMANATAACHLLKKNADCHIPPHTEVLQIYDKLEKGIR